MFIIKIVMLRTVFNIKMMFMLIYVNTELYNMIIMLKYAKTVLDG